MPVSPSHFMRLTDDVLVELHDVYLGGAGGGGLAFTCRRTHRLTGGRFAVVNASPGAGARPPPGPAPRHAAIVHLAWNAAVAPYRALADWVTPGLRELVMEGGPCRDPAGLAAGLARCTGLRRFRWSVHNGRPATDPDTPRVLRAAAALPQLECLEVRLENCGLDTAALDVILCEPLRALRRTNRLRALSVDLTGNPRIAVVGVQRLVDAIASAAPTGESSEDRLERLTLILWDVDAEARSNDALSACARIGECTGLRHLLLDAGGMRQTSTAGVRAGLVDGVLRDGGPVRGRLRTLDIRLTTVARLSWMGSVFFLVGGLAAILSANLDRDIRQCATRDLFVAVGRCLALRSLTVDLMRCGLGDRDVARGILAPLVAGGPALVDLSLAVGGAVLGYGAADRLAALVPRLRSLALRGVVPESETIGRIMGRLRYGCGRLHRFELAARGWIDGGGSAALFDGSGWPDTLGVLRMELSETLTAPSGFTRTVSGMVLGAHLTDLHIGLRNTGLVTEQWEELCAAVGGGPPRRLRTLHLDVRHNRIGGILGGIETLTNLHRLTRLRLLFDGNPLSDWTDEESAAVCHVPEWFPRLCSFHLSLRNCFLPNGVGQRIALYVRTDDRRRHCRVSHSF